MSWVKLYFKVFKQILITTTAVNIAVNGFVNPNLKLFLSVFFEMLFITIIIFMAAVLYFWLRYEFPHKVKIFALRFKLFWKFMNYTENELKYFKFFINKSSEIYERREKQ